MYNSAGLRVEGFLSGDDVNSTGSRDLTKVESNGQLHSLEFGDLMASQSSARSTPR